MKERAGDDIIWAERQTDNRFAYFTEGAKRVFIRFADFLDEVAKPNRTYHYYYSFSDPPGKLKYDFELPPLMDSIMGIGKVTFWLGEGTLTRPHTDSMENMMCVYKGSKIFYVAPPTDRKYLYCGTQGYPDNYSPVEFWGPDYDRYPLFKNARVRKYYIPAGDCLFVPSYYWH